MPAGSLPDRPHLEQLRRQAKELRDAARGGDAAALGRIRAHGGDAEPPSLAAAQLTVAREHGFASWPRLKAEVEHRTMGRAQRVRAFLEASVRGPMQADVEVRNARAAQLLDGDPQIAGYDIRTAAVLGESHRIGELLAADPGLALRRDPESGLPPLLFVCLSRWHRIDPGRAGGMLASARLLLDAGASPNTTVGSHPQPGHCSALYAAAGLANHPALARLLLERGADPDTPAALYHTVFHPDHACLRLLLAAGARAEGGATLAAAISGANREAVRLLLAAGIDARQPLPPGALGETYEHIPPVPPVWAAIEFDCPTDLIELLLAHGADPNAPGPDGRAPFPLAVRRGRKDLARALRSAGASTELSDETELNLFLASCLQADRLAAQRQLERNRVRMDRLSDEDLATLVYAADHGYLAAVELMLDLGFPPGARRAEDGATALHAAAGAGSAQVVQLLLARGADIDARDTSFDATPLAWATVGSGERFGHDPDPDFVATVQTLIDAGANPDGVWVSAKPPSPEVADLLRRHGISGPDEVDR
jgi:ankyrin repeat protein